MNRKTKAYVNGAYIGLVDSRRIKSERELKLSLAELREKSIEGIEWVSNTKVKINIDYDVIELDIRDNEQSIEIVESRINKLIILNNFEVQIVIDKCTIDDFSFTDGGVFIHKSDICKAHIFGYNLGITKCKMRSLEYTGDDEYCEGCTISNSEIINVKCKDANLDIRDCSRIDRVLVNGNNILLTVMDWACVRDCDVRASIANISVSNGVRYDRIHIKADKLNISKLLENVKMELDCKEVYEDEDNIVYKSSTERSLIITGTKDVIKRKESVYKLNIFDGDAIDLDILHNLRFECVGKFKKKASITVRNYLDFDIFEMRQIKGKANIRVYYGTQPYYYMLSNQLEFKLLDKIPEGIIKVEDKLKLLQGNFINKMCNLADIEDRLDRTVKYIIEDWIHKGVEVEIPEFVYNDIQLMNMHQPLCTVFKSYNDFFHYRGKRELIHEYYKTGDITVLLYQLYGGQYVKILRSKKYILKAVFMEDLIEFRENNLITHRKFNDMVAEHVEFIDENIVAMRYLTKYDSNIQKIFRGIKNETTNNNNDNLTIRMCEDYLLPCSKGFLRLKKELISGINGKENKIYRNVGYLTEIKQDTVTEEKLEEWLKKMPW